MNWDHCDDDNNADIPIYKYFMRIVKMVYINMHCLNEA
jgi:hypothetical protein